MNKIDKVTRETKLLIDSAKDTVASQLVDYLKSANVSLPNDQVSSVVSVVNLAIDTGYQKSIPTFQNSIKKHL